MIETKTASVQPSVIATSANRNESAHVEYADTEVSGAPEVSIVMPCLNEADTLRQCISKAAKGLADAGIRGEIIVADNGSTDGSQELALSMGAIVVNVTERGYGNALAGGIERAQAPFILMGDADDSYDFSEVAKFVEKLREGYDLVQGCRLPSGGGRVMPGAMPMLHRWCGNPAFSLMARWWFAAPVHDVYCGMRAFTRKLYDRLNLRSPGMEFATEMIIKASRSSAKISEVPITLHVDGRKSHPPHLRTFRDGWRTLRFYLMHCPRWLFLEPGKYLILVGIFGYLLALKGVQIGSVHLDLNTLVVSSLAILCGQQAVLFAIGTKVLAVKAGTGPDPRLDRFFKIATLERGLVLGLAALCSGIAMLVMMVLSWRRANFGSLDLETTMRWVITGATLVAGGLQTMLWSFFISIIGTLYQPESASPSRKRHRRNSDQPTIARKSIATVAASLTSTHIDNG